MGSLSLVPSILQYSTHMLSKETQDLVLKEIFEFYQKTSREAGLELTMLNAAIEGKLFIKEEYKRLGQKEFLNQLGKESIILFNLQTLPIGSGVVFPEELSLDKQVKILTDTLKRLYKKTDS